MEGGGLDVVLALRTAESKEEQIGQPNKYFKF
jgi:hypothetical protein